MRHALVYVLQNARKHGWSYAGADPFSSGPWFAGWTASVPAPLALGPRPCAAARAWLLRIGWARHGRLRPHERPRP